MTSNINYTSINENFPIAGQDNDTQVFRDNFDTIKTSLRTASTEITDLQDNVARVDIDSNDFNLNTITNAVFLNVREEKNDLGSISASTQEIDFQNGSYVILRAGNSMSLEFSNFPGDGNIVPVEVTPIGVGKLVLELYGDGTSRTITFAAPGGMTWKKNSSFPGVLTVSSTEDPVIIEVWRHSSEVMFANYLGQFTA